MVSLAAELTGAKLIKGASPSKFRKALSQIFRRAKGIRATESCLLICAGPADLTNVMSVQGWRTRFKYLAAWIIDSFWLDHLSNSIRLANPFDQIFVTSCEDIDDWKKLLRSPVSWLPWGTDALRLGTGSGDRAWDVTRVGRQPPEWDDDASASEAASRLGLLYRGRPSTDGMSAIQNHRSLMQVYGSSRYLLAFSNAVNPESYTHPTREYLTGRWVDALACGCTVAGVAPRGPGTARLLWEGATLELGGVGRSEGLQILRAAVNAWRPERANFNYAMALRKLDWRWRFAEIANAYGENPPSLSEELVLLRERVALTSMPLTEA